MQCRLLVAKARDLLLPHLALAMFQNKCDQRHPDLQLSSRLHLLEIESWIKSYRDKLL